ncbi:hypothetical protein ACH5RR_036852 [Cinchona calisaya]|uniref:Uncharacterized protein n=1 Tax=Cinchona calisaya TaxID=153742 RepID=A0ABD2Y5Q0_9GENT
MATITTIAQVVASTAAPEEMPMVARKEMPRVEKGVFWVAILGAIFSILGGGFAELGLVETRELFVGESSDDGKMYLGLSDEGIPFSSQEDCASSFVPPSGPTNLTG